MKSILKRERDLTGRLKEKRVTMNSKQDSYNKEDEFLNF